MDQTGAHDKILYALSIRKLSENKLSEGKLLAGNYELTPILGYLPLPTTFEQGSTSPFCKKLLFMLQLNQKNNLGRRNNIF